MRTVPSLYRSLSEEVRRERSPRRDARIGRSGKEVSIPIHPVLLGQIVQAGSVPLRTVRIAIKVPHPGSMDPGTGTQRARKVRNR